MMNPPQQPTIRPCPECGGPRVGARCYGGGLGRGHFTGGSFVTGLKTLVCLRCGHTSFYTEDLAKSVQDVQKHPEDFTF
jgi:hypothetical protein